MIPLVISDTHQFLTLITVHRIQISTLEYLERNYHVCTTYSEANPIKTHRERLHSVLLDFLGMLILFRTKGLIEP